MADGMSFAFPTSRYIMQLRSHQICDDGVALR
jgi:hypothetical protein